MSVKAVPAVHGDTPPDLLASCLLLVYVSRWCRSSAAAGRWSQQLAAIPD